MSWYSIIFYQNNTKITKFVLTVKYFADCVITLNFIVSIPGYKLRPRLIHVLTLSHPFHVLPPFVGKPLLCRSYKLFSVHPLFLIPYMIKFRSSGQSHFRGLCSALLSLSDRQCFATIQDWGSHHLMKFRCSFFSNFVFQYSDVPHTHWYLWNLLSRSISQLM